MLNYISNKHQNSQ